MVTRRLSGIVLLCCVGGWLSTPVRGGETAPGAGNAAAASPAERLTEAPEAATVARDGGFAVDAVHGQLPKLFQLTAGIYVTQSGLYDFNVNARGFNRSANRRMKVLIDGRDASVAFFGSEEWAAYSFPLDDLARTEVVRGPSSALYGAKAASGVVDLITRQPKDDPGGRVRITGGERGAGLVDAVWNPVLSEHWFAKLLAGGRRGRDFSEPRTLRAEYSELCTRPGQTDCLPRETGSFDPSEENEIAHGAVRFDRHAASGGLLTFELGGTGVEGPVLLTGLGRLRIGDVSHRWTRTRYSSEHWSFLATYKSRDADRQEALATGDNLALDDKTWKGEITRRWDLFDGRVLLAAGLSHEDERIDSLDARGPLRPSMLNPLNRQTLLFEPVQSQADAAFAKIDWRFGERLKLVAGMRYDDSTLYDPQWSPRASLVAAFGDGHTLRLTYHEAFVSPNYAELFLQHDVEAARNLAHLEPICALDGVACGFDVDFLSGEDPAQDSTPDTRVLAVGNRDLEVEQTTTWEVGYAGRLGEKTRLTLVYHSGENESFLTDLLPQLGTALGRVNPSFGPYEPPDDLSPARRADLFAGLAAALGPDLVFLTNNVDGTPILVFSSYTNLGRVDFQGFDLDLAWEPARGWSLVFSYSRFDSDIRQSAPGLDSQLLANTPANQASLAAGYSGQRLMASLRSRWYDDFRWASGPFEGNVDSTFVVDLAADVRLSDHWSFGLYVSNLLDEKHFESFGGDLLARRALASVSLDW